MSSVLFLIIIGCRENIDSKKHTAKAPTELQKKLKKMNSIVIFKLLQY